MTQEPITIIAFSMLFIPFTLVVGHFLRTRGDVFLRFVFGGESTAVSATNFLLNIGFYLLCLGLLLLNIGSPSRPGSWLGIIQEVAIRLGLCVTVVAVLHSVNVLVLALLIRRNRTLIEEPPPQLGATRRATAHSRPRRAAKPRARRR